MDADRCVSCGAVIPEGRITCPMCDAGENVDYCSCQHVWTFDGLVEGESGERYLSHKCAKKLIQGEHHRQGHDGLKERIWG